MEEAMTEPRLDLETNDGTATLHVRRPLAIADLGDGCIACASLPARVREFRIDARGLEEDDAQTREVLRELARFWMRLRGLAPASVGSEPPLVTATATPPQPTRQAAIVLVPDNAALTGAFL